MNIAILGGSFDPPHLGHILIARQVKELLPVDKVWLMPCFQHTFNKKLSPPQHRLVMTKFLEDEGILASDFEIVNKSQGFTIETLRGLSKQFPKHRFSWIIGSDQLIDFHKWGNDWRAIFTEYQLVVFPREVALSTLPAATKKALHLASIPKTVTLMQSKELLLTNISSSAIRKRVKKGLPIDLLVPKGVNEYVQKHGLYR